MAIQIAEKFRGKQGFEAGLDGAVVQVVNGAGQWIGKLYRGTPNVGTLAKNTLTVSGTVNHGEIIGIGTAEMVFTATGTVEEGQEALDISEGTKGQASNTLTVTGVPVEGDAYTIGDDRYEFDTDASVEEGSIPVVLEASVQASGTFTLSEESAEDTFTLEADQESVVTGTVPIRGITSVVLNETPLAGDDPVDGFTAVLATGVITFGSNVTILNEDVLVVTYSIETTVSDGETVTIGDKIYEFDTDGEVTEGHERVWVGENVAASAAITALAAVINRLDSANVVAVDGARDTLDVTAVVAGTVGNSIVVNTDCANGSWDVAEGTLEGGEDPTTDEIITAMLAAAEGGTEAVTLTQGEGEEDDTIIVEATAAGELDGSAGNAVEMTSDSEALEWETATMTGGYDATAAEALALLAELEIEDMTITAGTGDDDDKLFFVYDDATDEANEIATTSTAPNIAWETETMAGGVTPTVYPLSTKDTHMIDDTNLYVAVKVGSAIVWKYVALTTLEPH